MARLTEAQRKMLSWLATTDLEVPTPVVADSLVKAGLAMCLHDAQNGEDFYRITEAGRRAFSHKEGGS